MDQKIWGIFLQKVQKTSENSEDFVILRHVCDDDYCDHQNCEPDRKRTEESNVGFDCNPFTGIHRPRDSRIESEFKKAREMLICCLMLRYMSKLHNRALMVREYRKEFKKVQKKLLQMVKSVLPTIQMLEKEKRRILPAMNRLMADGTDDLKQGPYKEDWMLIAEFRNAELAVVRYDKNVHKAHEAYKAYQASMHAQPGTSAVGGAAVGTNNKRVLQEDADTTGAVKSKKPHTAKKPEPRKTSSVTPASPGPSSQPTSQPTPEAQIQPHGKTCELPHCDNQVEGDAQFCKTINCGQVVGLEQKFCDWCKQRRAQEESGSSNNSSDEAMHDCFDSCAECQNSIPTDQGYCSGGQERMRDADETESEDNEDEDQ